MEDSFPDRDAKDLDPDDRKLMEEDKLYFKGYWMISLLAARENAFVVGVI